LAEARVTAAQDISPAEHTIAWPTGRLSPPLRAATRRSRRCSGDPGRRLRASLFGRAHATAAGQRCAYCRGGSRPGGSGTLRG
jgi:hypothetical protein